MFRRPLLSLAAATSLALLSACAESGEQQLAGGPEQSGGGYTLEVRADDNLQVFLVTAPDGRQAAGRVESGVSSFMEGAQIQSLGAMPPTPSPPAGDEAVSVRAPGFSLSIAGESDAGGEGGGRVAINVGGHSVEVNAEEAGVNDRAHVRIGGVDAGEAREFIEGADELSADVRSQMLAALGLDDAPANDERATP